MKVTELILALSLLPRNADVGIIYDGADRADAAHVWLAKSGRVLVSYEGSECSWLDGDDLPLDA